MSFDPDHLAALSTILRHGSFEAAAAELLVTPSAVSQRIRTLEERVGASLIRRGQPCTATPTGARLAKHAEDITLLEAQLARDLSLDSRPYPAQVRLAVNADSLATWFVTALANLPDLLVDLVIDDQDHSADWLRDGPPCSGLRRRSAWHAALCRHRQPGLSGALVSRWPVA